jgi:hypothetical protein
VQLQDNGQALILFYKGLRATTCCTGYLMLLVEYKVY